MDETTKVIIATLSGFIIAFFAEPVKNYFDYRAKLHNLSIALYKEMLDNYTVLVGYAEEDVSLLFQRDFLARNLLRTECYKNTIQHEISLFYQLPEASKINLLYNSLIQRIIETSDIEGIPALAFISPCWTYLDLYAQSFDRGTFDKKILMRLVSKGQYREIIQRGKRVSEASENGLTPPSLRNITDFIKTSNTTHD